MKQPGGLDDLGAAGHHAWKEMVARCHTDAHNDVGGGRGIQLVPDDRTPHAAVVEWSGLPSRVAGCVTRAAALPLLDWVSSPTGVRPLQEEYVEWRVVRDDRGMRRVEFTTEFAAYWRILAAFSPQRILSLVGEFAGGGPAPVTALYGSLDPFGVSTTPADRAAAFTATMLAGDPKMSAYNDGRQAICCLTQPTNTLSAVVRMAVAATRLGPVIDPVTGTMRPATADEAIPLLDGTAVAGRASDPVLVERLLRLATEGRRVAFDDPVGVYLQSVTYTRLRTRDGDPVPPEWFRFSRGVNADQSADGRSRWQRLMVEVPADTGLTMNDLVDVATEQPIRYGGQIADLVQVALLLRISDRDALEPPAPVAQSQTASNDVADDCSDVRRSLAAYRRSRPDVMPVGETPQ